VQARESPVVEGDVQSRGIGVAEEQLPVAPDGIKVQQGQDALGAVAAAHAENAGDRGIGKGGVHIARPEGIVAGEIAIARGAAIIQGSSFSCGRQPDGQMSATRSPGRRGFGLDKSRHLLFAAKFAWNLPMVPQCSKTYGNSSLYGIAKSRKNKLRGIQTVWEISIAADEKMPETGKDLDA